MGFRVSDKLKYAWSLVNIYTDLAQSILELRNLSFTYRGTSDPALKQVSYAHDPGEFTVFMGPTGAGKSTFCRCLNGLIPTFIKGDFQGDHKVAGLNADEKHQVYEFARRIGLVFQDFEAQLFSTNVELEAAFALENFAVPKEEMADRVEDALQQVGLTGFEQRDPSTLSGGEKQRLAIASVLAGRPTVVVMDEPTTDLDPIGKRDIFSLARTLRGEIQGIILVEHETEHIIQADRVFLMYEGCIIKEGTPASILSDPDFLEQHGVRPLQTTVLLQKLGLPTDALAITEAVTRVQAAGWQVNHIARLEESRENQPPIPKEVVVHVKDLVHTYDAAKPAVDCVSLDIYRGEFVAVVGQNGCGKTTLVKHLNGLHAPTSGTVEILGKDTKDWTLSDLGKKVGFVFQNPDHQIFANTIREEVSFGPYNYGLSEAETEKKVSHALDIVGLADQEDEDPFSLTKGERQQLALASVLATDPDVLILDEPTTGLDYHGQTAILNLIRKLNESGRTIIIITHSMWVVAEYADRCIMMSQGKIVKDSDMRTCFKDMDLLESLHLEAPEAVRIGHAFGMTVRSVDELVACLVKSARR